MSAFTIRHKLKVVFLMGLRDSLIKLLDLAPSGNQGWLRGTCPYCDRRDFSILFMHKALRFRCFRATCGAYGDHYKISTKLGLQDLSNDIFEIDIEAREVKVAQPFMFKRLWKDSYLDSRGFKFYKRYIVGRSIEYPAYVIFLLYQRGAYMGWVGRDTSGSGLRYRNSEDTPFGKMLFGIDEVSKGDTIFLMEGLFDKFSFDKAMDTHNTKGISSVVSFGSLLTGDQIALLKERSPSRVVMLYDRDALNKTINSAFTLGLSMEVRYCLPKGDIDVGGMYEEEIRELVQDQQEPLLIDSFFSKKDKRLFAF